MDEKELRKSYLNNFVGIMTYETYIGYIKLLKENQDYSSYEAKAFTYNGKTIENPFDRVYDSLSDLYVEMEERLSNGDCSGKVYSYVISIIEEIHVFLMYKELEKAINKLVALQLFLGMGTKFRSVLVKFVVTGELNVSVELFGKGLNVEKIRQMYGDAIFDNVNQEFDVSSYVENKQNFEVYENIRNPFDFVEKYVDYLGDDENNLGKGRKKK